MQIRTGINAGSAAKLFDKLISAEQLSAQHSWENRPLSEGPKQKLLGRTFKNS